MTAKEVLIEAKEFYEGCITQPKDGVYRTVTPVDEAAIVLRIAEFMVAYDCK